MEKDCLEFKIDFEKMKIGNMLKIFKTLKNDNTISTGICKIIMLIIILINWNILVNNSKFVDNSFKIQMVCISVAVLCILFIILHSV